MDRIPRSRAARLARVAVAPVVALAVAIAAVAPHPAGARIEDGLTLDAGDRTVLAAAEAELSDIRSLTARIVQITSSGAYAEGDLAIKRPGRMRLDYDPPSEITVIADGDFLIYVDEELDQVSHLGLDATPAGILLRDRVSFADPEITVTGVRRAANVAEVDVVQSGDPAAGRLTLVFEEAPFRLRQWRVLDAQGVETTVSLFDVRTGVALDDGRFDFAVPVRRNPLQR